MAAQTNPFDRLVDLAVFAPVGLALELRKQVPGWAKSGRSELDNRVKLARLIGQFAVKQGRVEVAKRLDRMAAERAAAPPVIVEAQMVIETDAVAPVADASRAESDITDVVVDATSLPIEAYDSLAASQVVARLEALSAVELATVRAYEMGHRGRRTILGKIAQLEAG